jgi:hypothetical protein
MFDFFINTALAVVNSKIDVGITALPFSKYQQKQLHQNISAAVCAVYYQVQVSTGIVG